MTPRDRAAGCWSTILLIEVQAEVVPHVLEVLTKFLHFTLCEPGLFGKKIPIGRRLAEFLFHVGKTRLDPISELIKILRAGLNHISLRLIERLSELRAGLFKGAEVLLNL